MARSSASSRLGQDIGIQPGVVELALRKWDEAAPLVAQAKHVGDERLAVGEVAIAMEQEVAQRGGRSLRHRRRAAAGYGARPRGGAGRRQSAGVRRPPLPERTGSARAISAHTESMVRMFRRCG